MSAQDVSKFLDQVKECFNTQSILQLKLTHKRSKTNEIKSVTAKLIEIKQGLLLSFVYRYPTKDITKNYSISDSISIIEELLQTDFMEGILSSTIGNWNLIISEKNTAKINFTAPVVTEKPVLSHDKIKNRIIATANNIYLKELGILTADWQVKNTMQDKYRQINKYIEIIDGVLKSVKLPENYTVVDMGAGKGYLTFALYDYLVNVVKQTPKVIGIELRKELVTNCNLIAKKAGFGNLYFNEGTIQESDISAIDVLIALHACDTATDDAIYKGIKANASVIICAPCCHKQIRKQLNPVNELEAITKYGILKERQAEILTDTIRALLLEANGYKTNVFEFIETEHTPKNVLIVGIKQNSNSTASEICLNKIAQLKLLFGIKVHYLEELLK